VVRIAAPLGRQADALVCRSVAALLDSDASGPLRVLHVDDLIRFLVIAVGTDRTGVVDLATADTTTAASAHQILGGIDPRPKVRGVPGWAELCPTLDLAALRSEWDFECGWGATEAVDHRRDVDDPPDLLGTDVRPPSAAGETVSIRSEIDSLARVPSSPVPWRAPSG
jgi:hypothetical protein